jgi:hypothetical protein
MSIRPPRFDDRSPDWQNFEEDWEMYWQAISLGREYGEAMKLQIFESCLCDSLKQEIKFLQRSGAKPGFTPVFARIKARYAPENNFEARRAWYNISLKTPGKTTRADWNDFWVRFMSAQLSVKDTSAEEAFWLLLNRVPEFISKWITEDSCIKTQKNPRVRMFAPPDLSDQVLSNTIISLVGTPPKAVKSMGGGEYIVAFDSRTPMERLINFNGRRIANYPRPLQIEGIEWKITLDEIFRLVDDKL